MSVRFTRQNVNSMYNMVLAHHGRGDSTTKFLYTALQMGSDIGHGSRYIGMGGQIDVQYGPKGARKAVAYIWGMGMVLGVWDRLEKIAEVSDLPYARIDLDLAEALVTKALKDLGYGEYGRWTILGQGYASKAR